MLCFFRSLIDFDWIKGHLISDRVGSGRVRIRSDQFDFLKKIDRVGFGSDSGPSGSCGFLGLGRVLPPLVKKYKMKLMANDTVRLMVLTMMRLLLQ
jgi:hypothetical protein